MTQDEIAATFGVSRRSIVRDLEDLRPAQAAVNDRLAALTTEITSAITVKQRAEKYAELATSAKNEAVSLGALQRIDDLDGIVTEKERLRSKGVEHSAPAPMFVLPQGANISMTFNTQVNTTTSSEGASLHNVPSVTLPSGTTIGSNDE